MIEISTLLFLIRATPPRRWSSKSSTQRVQERSSRRIYQRWFKQRRSIRVLGHSQEKPLRSEELVSTTLITVRLAFLAVASSCTRSPIFHWRRQQRQHRARHRLPFLLHPQAQIFATSRHPSRRPAEPQQLSALTN